MHAIIPPVGFRDFVISGFCVGLQLLGCFMINEGSTNQLKMGSAFQTYYHGRTSGLSSVALYRCTGAYSRENQGAGNILFLT